MYRKSHRALVLERKRVRCATMRAAKERRRLAERFDAPDWRRVRTLLVAVYAHSDGRHAGLWINGAAFRCGSERAVRGALARMMWTERRPINARR